MNIHSRLMANLDTILVNGKNRDLSPAAFRDLVNGIVQDLMSAIQTEASTKYYIPLDQLPTKFYGIHLLIEEQEKRRMELVMDKLADEVRSVTLKVLERR